MLVLSSLFHRQAVRQVVYLVVFRIDSDRTLSGPSRSHGSLVVHVCRSITSFVTLLEEPDSATSRRTALRNLFFEKLCFALLSKEFVTGRPYRIHTTL